MIWLIYEPKTAALVATIFVDFLNNKNKFLHKTSKEHQKIQEYILT